MSNGSAPRATPRDFAATFCYSKEGQAVLDELGHLFGGSLWADTDGGRARRIGQREVIEHIHAQILKAEPPPQRKGG